MPSRKSHKKSKTGCQTCKKRRIKCDEVHPKCGNCLHHSIPCDFELLSLALDGDGRQNDTPNSPVVPENRNIMELRLMYTYNVMTSKTLTVAGPDQEKTWGIMVPELALQAPYLMDVLFAVSALHLQSMHSDDPHLTEVSHQYMASAIAQYKSVLASKIDHSNAESLFITSSLIAFYHTAARSIVSGISSPGFETRYELPLEWFYAYQGVKTVVLNSWEYLRDSERVLPIIRSQPALSLDMSSNGQGFFDSLLNGMEDRLQYSEEPAESETRQAYQHSVAYLNWAHQGPDRNKLMGFAPTVSRRFVDLLAEQDPRALVIVACFFAMIRAVDDIWWLQGIAMREVSGIFDLLPDVWRPLMQWAIRVSSSEMPLSPEVWGDFVKLQDNEGDELSDVRPHIDFLVSKSPSV